MIKSIFILAVNFVLLLPSAFAQSKGVKVDVTLEPAGSFTAVSEKVKGSVKRANGGLAADKITVPVSSLNDTNKLFTLRTEHMQKEFKSDSIVLTKAVGQAGKGSGLMSMNGIEKTVNFTYKEIGKGYVEAKFDISLQDFGFRKINYQDTVGVMDKVSVTATIPVVD